MDELGELQGTWMFDVIEVEGTRIPDAMFRGSTFTIQGDHFITVAQEARYEGKVSVNPEVYPKTIDMAFTAGPEVGKTSYGIYELEGNTLKIGLGLTGFSRPKEFVSKPRTGHALAGC
jgi:uncharacterized protein (TIGR03067 family)